MIKALEKGDIDLVNEATAPMAKEAKKSKEKLKFYLRQVLIMQLLVLYHMIMIKLRIKLVKFVQNMKVKNLDKLLLYAIDRKNGLMHSSMVMELKSIHTFLQQNGLQLIQKI